MKAALVALAAAATPASADDSTWRLDLGVRGAGSVELDSAPSMDRGGVVPTVSIRAQRRFGSVLVGGYLGAGMPAWYGQHELSGSIDFERVLRAPDEETDTARLSLTAGLDAGVAMLFYDAPPELSASSDALMYWGPLARARLQLHALWPTPIGKLVGVVVGVGVAASRSHYISTASGTGVRLEPGVEVALEVRL